MRSIFCFVVLTTLGMTSSFAQFASDRNRDQPPAGTNDPVLAMSRDLQEARELLKRMPASANRDRVELLLTRTELQLKQLAGRMAEGVAKRKPVSPEDFNRLLVSMRNQAFDKDKYTFLETTTAGRHFTCDQAAQLLKLFSFDSDRAKGALLLHPGLTDPENFHRVLEVFIFDGNKKSLMERLKTR